MALSIISTSCRMDKPDPLPEGPVRTVYIQIEREGIEEGNEPLMAKGYPNDLYAIQVNRGSLNKYAYGIFNNVDELKLELAGGQTYKIEVTMVGDGATMIAKDEETGGYKEPFLLNGSNGGGVLNPDNQFKYSSVTSLFKLSSGQAAVHQPGGTTATFDRAPVSRFYGIVDKFNPDENTSLSIKLKWVVFGLTVIPEGFTAGRIEVELEGAPTMTITPADPTAVTKKIFSFRNGLIATDWCADDYSEEIPMTITWHKSDGTSVVLRDGTVTKTTFQRRTEKIIRLQLSGGSMSITKEDETLIGSPEEVLTVP